MSSQSNSSPNDDLKMYVMVNKELPPLHGGIQAAHSIHEIMFNHKGNLKLYDWASHHKTLVFLGASEVEMILMMNYFDSMKKIYSSFKEPDLDNLLTAIAFEPLTNEEAAEIFPKDKFKLYR